MNPRIYTGVLAAVALVLLAVPAAPQSGPPGAPSLSGTAQSTTSILWSWSAVTDAIGYELHDGGHQVIASLGAVTSHLESGLQENINYVRHLHAINPTGMSAAGLDTSRFTRIHDPLASDLTVTLVSSSRVEIEVVPPPNPAPVAVNIYRSTNQTTWTTLTFTNRFAIADTNLLPLTTYYYKFNYVNAGVATPDSPLKSITTPDGPPAAPTGFTAPVVTTTSVQWSWAAVTGATGYEVHDENHALLQTVAGTTWTEFSLTENTQYQRHVHARSGVFLGARSAELFVSTSAHPPVAADFTVTVLSGADVDVRVVPLPNRAAWNSGAQIESSTNGVNWSLISSDNGNGTTYSVHHGGRTANTTYHYRFRYREAGGTFTAYSPVKMVTTTSATALPVNSIGTSWTPLSTSEVRWNWNAVAGVTAYEVHDDNHNLVASTAPGVTTYTDTNLTENTPVVRHFHARFGTVLAAPSLTYIGFANLHNPTLADFEVTSTSPYSNEIRVHHPVNWTNAGYHPATSYQTDVSIDYSPDNVNWSTIKNPFFNPGFGIWDHGNLGPGITHYYRISLRAAGGAVSGPSPALAVTVAKRPE
jgi:hypothetical protein